MGRYEEHVRREIAKHTGLTGVEAGHIERQLVKQGIDYQTMDWKTIGENMYGHGHRTGGLKKVVSGMYNINIGESDERGSGEYLEMEVHTRQSRRKPAAIKMDEHINAKHQFKMSNEKGVRRWLKKPNMYDIIGVDDIIRF